MAEEKIGWAIVGLGNIAGAFAKGLKASKTGELIAVGSRTPERAAEFAKEWGARGNSYEDAIEHPGVKAVYIACEHSGHAEWTKFAASKKKAVLCEKPFTLDLESAEEALAVVKKSKTFFAEAFMYRFHPQTIAVKEMLDSGVIGEVAHIRAEFSFQVDGEWNNFRAKRMEGGGGLMDVGCYCVSATRFFMGGEPERCEFVYHPSEDGYDGWGTGLMQFSGNRTANFGSGVRLEMQNRMVIYGTQGQIEIESPWFCKGNVWVRPRGGDEVEHGPWEVDDLYGNEADMVARHLAEKEIPYMTQADTLGNMRALDMLRKSGGLSFG